MDLILSEVAANTVASPELVLSEAVPRFFTDEIIVDIYYRLTANLNTPFKYLASVPVGDTAEIPIDLKGQPITISTVTRVGDTLQTTDPRRGEFYDHATDSVAEGENREIKVATENLAAGDLVNIWNNGGTVEARKADNSNNRPAHGWVPVAVTATEETYVLFGGLNTFQSGLVGGAVYLGTSGGVTQTVPSASGEIVQDVGVCLEATKFQFEAQPEILLT